MKKILFLAFITMALFACKNGKTDNKADEEKDTTEQQADNDKENESEVTADAETEEVNILDFTLPNSEFEQVNAMDIIQSHKVTIIDFWASWCAPCCAEMPNMVELYEKYSDKGLGILGVSLDQNMDDWKAAMNALDITWPSVIDTDGFVAEKFNVQYIPYTLIVSKEGEVLNQNLRGDELAEFIAGLLE